MVFNNAILFLMAPAVGGVGAWAIARWGGNLSLLDRPNERSSHDTAVPKGGGIGILIAFVFCSLSVSVPPTFWVTSTVLSLLSFWGDRSEISPKIRLAFQFMASLVVVSGVLLDKQATISVYVLVLPLLFFVVGTANCYNFMDGINGIAGISGIVGFGLLGWFSHVAGADSMITVLCVCLSLACLGFLPMNMPNARVFMGDMGSILLGFVFAGMVVWISRDFLDFLVVTAFLFPFYADEFSTLVARVRVGEKLTRPHRRHIYQLLANEKGISHWKISVAYGLLQLFVGVSVLLGKSYGIVVVLPLLVGFFSIFAMIASTVRRNLERRAT